MSTVHNSTLLYRPSVSVWTARKRDKNESVKVNSDAGAVAGAANVHKQLLPDSPELEAVQKCATAFRTWIYTCTLPWDDSGWRIGRVARHMDFMQEAGDKMRDFDVLVDAFVMSYAQAIENAKFQLNTMFNAADYPGINEMRAKFAINVDVSTLPNTEDFRVVDGVPADEVERMVGIATQGVSDKIAAGMEEAYKRLLAVVSKMASTLTQYGDKEIKKFNDTLTGNIADLVEVMPALNITDDPKLTALCADAKRLLDYDLTDLRKDDLSRKAAIKDAEALIKKFSDAPGQQVVKQPTVASGVTAELFNAILAD